MDEYLTCTWEEFEAWIRRTIGSNFRWKIRPFDNYSNPRMIADLIRDAMKRNNGVFPRNDTFIEPVEE
jgi:hypothetical protein